MSRAATTQTAAPVFQRKSDHCLITVDFDLRKTDNGLMTTNYNVWVGSLWDGDETYGEYDLMTFESGNSSTIRERDALIRSLKFQAREMEYKRCEVRDNAGTGVPTSTIFDGALRATRREPRAYPTSRSNRTLPIPEMVERMV